MSSLTSSVQERKPHYDGDKHVSERQHSLVSLIENLNGGGNGSGTENTYNQKDEKKMILKTLSGVSDSKESLPYSWTGTQKSALKKSPKIGKGKGRKSVKFDGGPKTNFQKKNFI